MIRTQVRQQESARPSPEQIAEGKRLKGHGQQLTADLDEVERALARESQLVPNSTHPAAPPGGADPELILSFGPTANKFTVDIDDDESGAAGNTIVDGGGDDVDIVPRRDHVKIAHDADLIDFAAGARVAGSKFFFLKNSSPLYIVRYLFGFDHKMENSSKAFL